MFTIAELNALPSGRVIKRMTSVHGASMKYRVIIPKALTKCDECPAYNLPKVVRFESSGNRALRTQCIPCAVRDLNKQEELFKQES